MVSATALLDVVSEALEPLNGEVLAIHRSPL
jgi:hypothetical protein